MLKCYECLCVYNSNNIISKILILVYEFRTESIADCKYPPFYELSDTLAWP